MHVSLAEEMCGENMNESRERIVKEEASRLERKHTRNRGKRGAVREWGSQHECV